MAPHNNGLKLTKPALVTSARASQLNPVLGRPGHIVRHAGDMGLDLDNDHDTKGAHMGLSPHLMFCGQCEEAFRFYERLLGAKIVTMLTYGNSPMAEQVSPEWRGKIVHASLTVTNGVLTGADILPEQYERPQGFYVLLDIDEPADAERVFRALADNGNVRMPIQQTFWSVRFGVLVDRFGIPWEVNCGQVASRGTGTSIEVQTTVR